MDSTLKSDLTVGPPIDFTVYRKDQYKIASQKCLNLTDDEYSKVCNQWSNGIFKIFDSFPRFEWEDKNKRNGVGQCNLLVYRSNWDAVERV